MRFLVFLCALLFSTAFAQDVQIRVLIAQQNKLQLLLPFSHYVMGFDGTVLYQSSTPVQWNLELKSGRILINGEDSGRDTLHFQETTGNQSLLLNGTRYRGAMSIYIQNGNLTAVNTLNIEDYLRSVVPAEMPASWPLEALKAQTIIARTYAIERLNPKGLYDLCATQQCQVYKGQSSENPLVDAAISQTYKQIIAYNQRPAKTFFSSDNGGFTASSAEVWGSNLPYLVAQPDPFSVGPKSSWSIPVSWTELTRVARTYGFKGTASGFRVDRYSPSGRVTQVSLLTEEGTAFSLSGAEAGGIVRALGAYSTRVNIDSTDAGAIISGSGFGHGVGLSQYGAKNMAERGYSSDQILGFYYPGVSRGSYRVAGQSPEPETKKTLTAMLPLSWN